MSAPTPWWVGPILENSAFKSNHYYCFYGVNNLRWSCMRILHYIEYPVWTLRWFINWEGEISDTTTFIVWGHLLICLFQLVTAACGCWARLGGQVKSFPTVTLIQVLVWPLEDFLFFPFGCPTDFVIHVLHWSVSQLWSASSVILCGTPKVVPWCTPQLLHVPVLQKEHKCFPSYYFIGSERRFDPGSGNQLELSLFKFYIV